MADLFSDLRSGFRMPDVRMNQGPLPSVAGGPAGSDGTADGRYNFNGNLLDGITPYSYGEAARAGSDRNYQQIPHRIQKIVPPLYLPNLDGTSGKKMMSHAVDQGDVAFIINLEQDKVQHILAADAQMHASDAGLQSLTPFCNIVTVNYLLAGLWRYGNKKGSLWNKLQDAFGMGQVSLFGENEEYDANKVTEMMTSDDEGNVKKREEVMKNLRNLVRFGFLPFGICAGSEHQGGKHETGLAPVVAAVNYVTTMTIDGQNRDLVNVWRPHNLANGDQLIYRIGWQTTRHQHTFTLNHYYKEQAQLQIEHEGVSPQLIPDILTPCMRKLRKDDVRNTATFSEFNEWGLLAPKDALADVKHQFQNQFIKKYNYRWFGYWRIGQMMHHRGPHLGGRMMTYDDDMQFLSGGLLQITFAPVWRQCDCKGRNDDGSGGFGGFKFEQKIDIGFEELEPFTNEERLIGIGKSSLTPFMKNGILISVKARPGTDTKMKYAEQYYHLDQAKLKKCIQANNKDLKLRMYYDVFTESKIAESADEKQGLEKTTRKKSCDFFLNLHSEAYHDIDELKETETYTSIRDLVTDVSSSSENFAINEIKTTKDGVILEWTLNLPEKSLIIMVMMHAQAYDGIKGILQKRTIAYQKFLEKKAAQQAAASEKTPARHTKPVLPKQPTALVAKDGIKAGMGGLFTGFQKLHNQFSSTPSHANTTNASSAGTGELPAAKQARVAGAASVSSATSVSSVSSVAASGVSKNSSAPTVASASHTPMQTDAKLDAQKDPKMDTKLDAKLDAKARAAQTMASHVGGVKSARKSKPKSATEEDAMDDA